MSSEVSLSKVPPQATEIEESVLGGMMMYPALISQGLTILKKEAFYDSRNQIIFFALEEMFRNDDKIDLLTVTQHLRDNGELEQAGGAFYLTTIFGKIVSVENFEYHVFIILQKYIQRELIRISKSVMDRAFSDEDPLDLVSETINTLMLINGIISSQKQTRVGEIYSEIVDIIEKIRNKEIPNDGIMTHLKDFNHLTHGLKAPDLYIIAGRPGMGKTAFLISIAKEIALQNIPVAVFSLEMSSAQITKRILSQFTSLPYGIIDNPESLSEYELQQIKGVNEILQELPLYIDDTPAINIWQLQSKATDYKQRNGVKLIIIDYLQLMSGTSAKGNKRETEISEISRGLKLIAKRLNIPVIALSQLNRGVELRPDKRPKLADLRESGAIEQDADVVGLLYRPSYYGITDIDDVPLEDIENYAELIIAKNRNGSTGTVNLRFIKETIRYVDYGNPENASPQIGMGIVEPETEPMPEITQNIVVDNDLEDGDIDSPF